MPGRAHLQTTERHPRFHPLSCAAEVETLDQSGKPDHVMPRRVSIRYPARRKSRLLTIAAVALSEVLETSFHPLSCAAEVETYGHVYQRVSCVIRIVSIRYPARRKSRRSHATPQRDGPLVRKFPSAILRGGSRDIQVASDAGAVTVLCFHPLSCAAEVETLFRSVWHSVIAFEFSGFHPLSCAAEVETLEHSWELSVPWEPSAPVSIRYPARRKSRHLRYIGTPTIGITGNVSIRYPARRKSRHGRGGFLSISDKRFPSAILRGGSRDEVTRHFCCHRSGRGGGFPSAILRGGSRDKCPFLPGSRSRFRQNQVSIRYPARRKSRLLELMRMLQYDTTHSFHPLSCAAEVETGGSVDVRVRR